mmetsp:Transcript_57029/g.90667  ORF Transcript_57029/g.90667 Transcript_57029/m.90667 type:complete len:208 (-) Transcript_57029:885-1508(-)
MLEEIFRIAVNFIETQIASVRAASTKLVSWNPMTYSPFYLLRSQLDLDPTMLRGLPQHLSYPSSILGFAFILLRFEYDPNISLRMIGQGCCIFVAIRAYPFRNTMDRSELRADVVCIGCCGPLSNTPLYHFGIDCHEHPTIHTCMPQDLCFLAFVHGFGIGRGPHISQVQYHVFRLLLQWRHRSVTRSKQKFGLPRAGWQNFKRLTE